MKNYAYTIIKPSAASWADGTAGAVEWPKEPGYDAIKTLVQPLLQDGIKRHVNFEHVAVLFKRQRASMFVDDYGAFMGLPVNRAATEIYHAASKARGADTSNAPMIYGTAILFHENVWR